MVFGYLEENPSPTTLVDLILGTSLLCPRACEIALPGRNLGVPVQGLTEFSTPSGCCLVGLRWTCLRVFVSASLIETPV